MFKYYRPAGNRILIKPSPFNADRFSPLSIKFYQSGTASLASAIIASRKLKGLSNKTPEVLLPAYACPDLISAVLFAGAKPILVDLQKNSFLLSTSDIAKKITPNSIAIIAVNFLGLSDQLTVLKKLCVIHQLFLINDSAQCFPKVISPKNWPGDFNIISFGRGKPVSLLHGGAVITKNDENLKSLEQVDLPLQNSKHNFIKALKIRIYNIVVRPFFYGILTHLPGINIGETKFTELAAITKIDSYSYSLLENNIKKYLTLKTNHEMIHQKLLNINNPKIIDLYPADVDNKAVTLLRYPFLITNKKLRDNFLNATEHLGVSIMYKRPLNEIDGLEDTLDSQINYPNASNFADHLVTIPTHEGIPESVINSIFDKLTTVLSEGHP